MTITALDALAILSKVVGKTLPESSLDSSKRRPAVANVLAGRSPILLAERKDHLDWTLFEPSDASFLCPRTAARPEFCTDAGRLYVYGFINPVNPVGRYHQSTKRFPRGRQVRESQAL